MCYGTTGKSRRGVLWCGGSDGFTASGTISYEGPRNFTAEPFPTPVTSYYLSLLLPVGYSFRRSIAISASRSVIYPSRQTTKQSLTDSSYGIVKSLNVSLMCTDALWIIYLVITRAVCILFCYYGEKKDVICTKSPRRRWRRQASVLKCLLANAVDYLDVPYRVAATLCTNYNLTLIALTQS